jgi:hypothetical protein
LFFDPDNNKVPVYPKTLLECLFGYDNYKFGDNPTEIPPGGPLSLRIKFLGKAQRLLKEVCTLPTEISVSNPDNTEEMKSTMA